MSSEKADVNLTVNGESHSVSVEPRELLAQTLRERLDYTSINIGCESTLCGACTIQVNGKAVKSCTRLTVQEDGSEIQTVQTLSDDGVLGDLQTAFADEHALQCGYCTPGILMVVDEYLDNNPDPSRDEIRTEALQGNLCRCTGYENIVDAIDIASDTLEE
jgi:carbon-monoxide dehydrogenase small subunit